jgi:OFA family oxalate/formate antiporter-like MFS transporter
MNRRGWIVTLAGMALNLALGILYAWSMFSKQLVEAVDRGGFGWTKMQATMPYTIAIACFAIMMVPAGRLQDKLGPRIVASMGGILTGVGLVIASFATPEAKLPALVGFGLFAGTGFGLGYSAATPAAIKWFPPEKKGLITGLVVGGFGIAPVYIAPLTKTLIASYGVATTFRILGLAFLVTATACAQLIRNPAQAMNVAKPGTAAAKAAVPDRTWKEAIRTWTFWSLYVQYVCGATAGLMIIGHMAKIVAVQSGNAIQAGFVFVALLAVFNASGRIVAGVISDYIGRTVTLAMVLVLQALVMFFFSSFTTFGGFVLGAAIVGFAYGACLCLFPAAAADNWGTKNLGMNYGILFTAWGVGGVVGPQIAARIADRTGSYEGAYHFSAVLLAFAIVLAMLSYVNVSVDVAERELKIKLGKQQAA